MQFLLISTPTKSGLSQWLLLALMKKMNLFLLSLLSNSFPLKFEYTPDKRNVVLSDKGFIIQSTSDIRNFDAVGHNAKKKNNFVSIEDFKREGKDVNSTDTSDSNESNFDRFVRLNSFSSYQFQGHIQFLMFIVEVSDRFKHQMPLFFTQEENPEWDRYEQQYRDSQKENTIE